MNQNEILSEAKKAIDLWMDKTYNESEFYSHILTIINDHSSSAEMHKDQFERFISNIETLRENQRLYHGGHKNLLGTCRSQEVDIDRRIMYLKSNKGYNTDRFKPKAKQEEMFK